MNAKAESLMMSYGYQARWSEGAIKPPIFQTSTFVFPSAEEGKAYFELAYGLKESESKDDAGLIYSRLSNPNLEIFEDRLSLWEGAEACAVFASGMAAIATTLWQFLKPGETMLYSQPIYGGTAHLIEQILPQWGINAVGFLPFESKEEIIKKLEDLGVGKTSTLGMVYVETPANPTNDLFDLAMLAELRQHFATSGQCPFVVDNTYLGPLWQNPLEHGADLVLYSATKYIGGHSDLIAGACLGSASLIQEIKAMRTFMGTMASPYTSWLLSRSLETLKIRMERQAENARIVASFLKAHVEIKQVHYLGFTEDLSPEQEAIFTQQCKGPGAMIAFRLKGGEKEAFCLLNGLKLIKLAVSLGGTESIAQHPASMTHAGLDLTSKQILGITDELVRLSIGIEHPDDLIGDLRQALNKIENFIEFTASVH
ncbi:MAG: cystathionine gamma-synthase family protein [Bacteroidia bacterium]